MDKASQILPKGEKAMPVEYTTDVPDRRAPLMNGGEVTGVFTTREMAEATRRFLTRFPKIGPR